MEDLGGIFHLLYYMPEHDSDIASVEVDVLQMKQNKKNLTVCSRGLT